MGQMFASIAASTPPCHQSRFVPSVYPAYDRTTGDATNANDANLDQFLFVECGRYYKSFSNPPGWPHMKLANRETFNRLVAEYQMECYYNLWVSKRDRIARSKGLNFLDIRDSLDAMTVYTAAYPTQGHHPHSTPT